MKIEDFINEIKKLGIMFNEEVLDKLEKYYMFLREYNSHTNLTAIIEKEDVYLKHFYDSLTIVKAVDLNSCEKIIDIGTGAGFPGMVLKIFFPHLKVTLLDSNNKKTKFLSELVSKLDLTDVTIVNDRAEEYAKKHLNEFDLCTSRAVAFLDIITELSLPFIKNDGICILMKGNFVNELPVLEKHYQELGISSFEIINFNLPIVNDERNLLLIKKSKISTKTANYAKIIKRNKIWNSK